MKKITIVLASLAVLASFVSCEKQLAVQNTNSQTTLTFGNTEPELQEALIACYNRIRLEGTFARVGYMHDVVRGDETWNPQNAWYLPADHLNSNGTIDVTDQWIWRDCFHVVNRSNFVITKCETLGLSGKSIDQIYGQALFLRALAYYTLATYYQTVPLYTSYDEYVSLESISKENAEQDEIFDQIEADLTKAIELLPSRNAGGEWANGRATCGAAAGYLARALMFRHKYSEALTVLKDIMNAADGGNEKYGHYELMADYGANFKEGAEFENNAESLFEVQYLDYGQGGVDQEWTPVNISSNATQGHALEANFGPGVFGGWGDVAMSNWLYNLYKAELCTDGRLDPRLYWTALTYEPEYETYTGMRTAAYPAGDPRCNVIYTREFKTPEEQATIRCNSENGGIAVAKHTNARSSLYKTIDAGLWCGVNVRLMRYSDVLLRAAECENELNGPANALQYINKVRNRAALASLPATGWDKEKLFEQIANVERPKEFGCENGRGIDLIRWGFFYSASRLNQIAEHSRYIFDKDPAAPLTTHNLEAGEATDDSFTNYFQQGHEYFPIFLGTLNANPKLKGNSANNNTDNGSEWIEKYGSTLHLTVTPLD